MPSNMAAKLESMKVDWEPLIDGRKKRSYRLLIRCKNILCSCPEIVRLEEGIVNKQPPNARQMQRTSAKIRKARREGNSIRTQGHAAKGPSQETGLKNRKPFRNLHPSRLAFH